MNINKLQPALEAILFAAGEPLEIDRLCQALETDEQTLKQVLSDLAAELEAEQSGICLLTLADKVQLCSKKEYADVIRDVLEIKKNTPLSQAAFEVLAIVAYNQPVTKSFIEQVRGVDCTAVIGSLCQKSLIEEKGRLELPGRPLVYGTTPEFLRCFCLSSLDELPPVSQEEMKKTDGAEHSEKASQNDGTEENYKEAATDEKKNQEKDGNIAEKVDENEFLE